jgi:fused signal recognition particle receptor
MRFWRRNLPAEPPLEAETPAAPVGEAETALRQPEPEFAPKPPFSAPDPAAEPDVDPAGGRQGWFRRRRNDPVEPTAEQEQPVLRPDQAAQNLREPETPESAPAPDAPADPGPAETAPNPPRSWLWPRNFVLPTAPEVEQEPVAEPAEPATEPPRPETGIEASPPLAPPPEPAAEAAPVPPAGGEGRGWFSRLRAGLSRSSARLNEGINAIFNRRRLDDAALEELEELLISSDMGIGVAGEVTQSLRRSRFNQEVSPEEVRAALAEQVIRLVEPVTRPLRIDRGRKPFVILVVGVNGSGKTTTIAKLAKQYRDAGLQVILAAGDTFRAAAVEQLQIWGERTGCAVVSRPAGADAAGLAYDALTRAQAEGADVLLVDTAGRLHNKTDLMGELQKIVRVLKKVDPDAPHSVLLVLDATTGQNAHAQAEIFREMVGVTGIVMTKLDGTARGGVLVSLAEKYGIPIHAIGVGETAEDLRPFEARAYARSLVGLDA